MELTVNHRQRQRDNEDIKVIKMLAALYFIKHTIKENKDRMGGERSVMVTYSEVLRYNSIRTDRLLFESSPDKASFL